jgi:hypothetical protein
MTLPGSSVHGQTDLGTQLPDQHSWDRQSLVVNHFLLEPTDPSPSIPRAALPGLSVPEPPVHGFSSTYWVPSANFSGPGTYGPKSRNRWSGNCHVAIAVLFYGIAE